MPTPSSGQISFADIALIVYNSSTSQVSFNDGDARTLAGITSGQISIDNFYNKPTASSVTFSTPGTYSWVVPAYKTLSATIAGGGGGGGSYCGGQVFFGCVNYCCSAAGNPGGNSIFNGVSAFGGAGGRSASGGVGADGGNSLNTTRGGGGAKGLGNTNAWDTNCNQAAGSNGGAGGYALKSWTKGVDGPSYGSTLNLTVGAGGPNNVATSCRDQRGGPGGNGYITISWS